MSKLFLFDIDGVIDRSAYFTDQYAIDFGVNSSEFVEFFTEEFPACIVNQSDLRHILPRHFKQWNWDRSVEEFIQYWFDHNIALDMQLLDFIANLRKTHHVGIASNQEKYRINYLLKTCGLENCFDYFYWSSELGYLKSDTRFYSPILTEYQGEIYFWDDTIENVKIANESGLKAFHYTDLDRFKSEIKEII